VLELDDLEVADVVTPAVARATVREALVALALGRAHNPLRAVAALPAAWFAAMPAYVDTGTIRALGAKMVCAFPQNAARGLPTHRATIVLFDPDTGELLARTAGDAITLRRTAAASVVATEALAARPRGTLAILGAGAQGRAHLEAFVDAELVTALRVWSRTPAAAVALAQAAAEYVGSVVIADDPDEAVRGADVIVTATASAIPLFAAASVAPHAHINAVGACVPAHRELAGDLVGAAAFYADSKEGALRESGDLLLALPDAHAAAAHVRGELGAVLASGAPVAHDRPTIYESLGLGVLDVACAAVAVRASGDRR
jgi:ornithine cyclodeaminase/alanine dehydrogenase-like protein (mu-crystallin family)